MTDEQIIKSFTKTYEQYKEAGDFRTTVYGEILDLINRQKAEIERYKGVIKILENDVKVANIEAVKNFAHFLIDRSKGGEIEVVDVADLAVEYMNTFGGNKDEQ